MMTGIERAANELAEALLVIHEYGNWRAQRDELTPAEADARMVYHHIHAAIKLLADVSR